MRIVKVRVYSFYGELTMRQGSSLVEYYDAYMSQCVHIVGAFYKDTLARGPSNTAKECKRYADDEGTRTRYYQEHQCAIEPCRENASQKRWNDGDGQSCEYHDRCVDTCKTCDESLTL